MKNKKRIVLEAQTTMWKGGGLHARPHGKDTGGCLGWAPSQRRQPPLLWVVTPPGDTCPSCWVTSIFGVLQESPEIVEQKYAISLCFFRILDPYNLLAEYNCYFRLPNFGVICYALITEKKKSTFWFSIFLTFPSLRIKIYHFNLYLIISKAKPFLCDY